MTSQLFRFAKEDAKVFGSWTPRDGVLQRPSGSFPRVRWPDGRWCLEVNLFLLSLLQQGFKHEPKGGTLGVYASHLSDLIRYCFDTHGKRFLSMTEGDFSLCVEGLLKKKRRRCGGITDANNRTTAHAIASVWLGFLSFVGELFGHEDFVSRSGSIRAYYKSASGRYGRRAEGSGWQHASLSFPRDPYGYRKALSDDQLDKLRGAVGLTYKSPFRRKRCLVMIQLFDTVGLRRIEASWLTVRNVRLAREGFDSLAKRKIKDDRAQVTLSFRMAKSKSKDAKREVPISAVDLSFLEEYTGQLERIMRRLKLPFGPETPLFPNLGRKKKFQGKPVIPNWFTLELYKLAIAAHIEGPCSPHMARHRYIVRELIRLILSHELENLDDFRRALIDSKGFIARLRQITGHKTDAGIEPYVQEAFDELTGMASILRRVDAHRGVDALKAARERFGLALENREDPMAAAKDLAAAVDIYQQAVQLQERELNRGH